MRYETESERNHRNSRRERSVFAGAGYGPAGLSLCPGVHRTDHGRGQGGQYGRHPHAAGKAACADAVRVRPLRRGVSAHGRPRPARRHHGGCAGRRSRGVYARRRLARCGRGALHLLYPQHGYQVPVQTRLCRTVRPLRREFEPRAVPVSKTPRSKNGCIRAAFG